MGIQTDTDKRKGFVCYTGSREELIAAGVAIDAMFPEAPRVRRYWKAMRNPPVADEFKTTKRGALWAVTREMGWEDPNYIREQHAAREAEREARIAEYHRRPAEREVEIAHARAAVKVERAIEALPGSAASFRANTLRVLDSLLAVVVCRGTIPLGGYSFDDATREEINGLVFEIRSLVATANVHYSAAKRLMEEAALRAPLLDEPLDA